ncbi:MULTISPECIES: type II toxin-antitoxin system HipA family toxin [unclassified Sphingomonas]|uniref:type II toxin-antitoxin system HipA family toxin n=1 Tax=unclassified Sphingomonas TaxID=196159 RepID=UPI00092C0121|nr:MULTISPECIES: type II toxin-antitoxin system HipA family toxin [unclassified Sphingomonas]MBN8848756.1 type II toxin-antitoxin system HipA family toxin [Sphingomonas sp.]OJV34349.1 MAG: phosphatidylinositol kinase [Sphingomonas sp. 67-36]
MLLPVHYCDRPVATILADADDVRLSYDANWLTAPDRFPISLTMPLGDAHYDAATILPWLMNLLPEGEPLRAMTRALGVSVEDVLGLIMEIGSDLAGALSIGSAEQQGSPAYRVIPDAAALERIITDLPARPFLVGEDGVSMSLAGAQDKLPVALRGDRLAIPVNGAPSTHILKPDNRRLPDSVQNEALCMVLARRIGLPTAPVTTGRAGERSYLLVTRYDREIGEYDARRIHQEDFCQALGRVPAAKYELNRTGRHGPSVADMFALLRQHMTARDITRLLDAVIFNIAIGNVDSHAKNYSILLPAEGPSLAPLYDLMSGLAWDGITQNHAQAIGGQRRGRHIYGRHWQRMAGACGLAAKATVRRVGDVTKRLLRELPAATEEVANMPAGSGFMLGTFSHAIEERIREVQLHAQQEGDDDQSGDASAAIGDSAY